MKKENIFSLNEKRRSYLKVKEKRKCFPNTENNEEKLLTRRGLSHKAGQELFDGGYKYAPCVKIFSGNAVLIPVISNRKWCCVNKTLYNVVWQACTKNSLTGAHHCL